MNLTGIDAASSALIAQAVEGLRVGMGIQANDEYQLDAILTIVLTIYRLGVIDGKIAGSDRAIAGLDRLLNNFPAAAS